MQITIRKEYFDNIETAVNALNNFFGSNCKTKNFPMIESNEQLDGSILSILSWMNNVDPTWIDGTDKVENAIERINQFAENHEGDEDVLTTLTNENNTSALDLINSFIGYKMLQFISDHFEQFSQLMNGIFSFELFTKPSTYQKAIDAFSKPVSLDEISDVLGDNLYQIFNEEKYIHGIFDNSQIKLPKELKFETEMNRFNDKKNLDNVEIVVDESVQEAADINFFTDMHPENLRYHAGLKVVQISKQFEAKVNQLVSGLRGCNTTEDLKQYFANFPFSPDDFSHVVIPCILARVFANSTKFPNQSFDQAGLKKYTDSYKSILGKNDGAKRFGSYDLFSTFKADKEGTIKFIEDFLKLRLVNDEDGMIPNNTLLTLFNIFDSRIYLDIMYNMLPSGVRDKMAPSEDAFVKKVRAKINRNSRNGNVYKKETPIPEENTLQTTDQVVEYVSNVFSESADITITDLMYCEHYADMVNHEINTLGDVLYNCGVSTNELNEYIGESFLIFQEANEASKKARKNAQQFMRDEYGTVNPKSLTSKQRNRMMKFLKDNDYDAKTGTLATDIVDKNGKQVRVKFDTNESIGRGAAYVDHYKHPDGIALSKSLLKQHPSVSNGNYKHEEGHYGINKYGIDVSDDMNKAQNHIKNINIESLKDSDGVADFHGINPEEYTVDLYSAKHNKYPDKTRFLRALKSDTPLMRKAYNQRIRTWIKGVIKSNDISDTESLKQFCNMVRPTPDMYEAYPEGKVDLDKIKNMTDRIQSEIKAGKTLKELQSDYMELIKFLTVGNDQNGKIAGKTLDSELDYRINFTKNHVKEYAMHYGMSGIEALQEMCELIFIDNVFQEADNKSVEDYGFVDGSIPDYMKTRIKLSDGDENNQHSQPVITDIQLPPDFPSNSYEDLIDSIDERLDQEGTLDDMIGSGYKGPVSKNGGEGHVVYNITNNYNNSYNQNTTTNTNSHNTNTDSSVHKNITNTTTTNSNNLTTRHIQNPQKNNNNNSTVLSDTKDSNVSKAPQQPIQNTDNAVQKDQFSNGKSIQEVFAILESEEPLSNTMSANAKPPKEDLLTKAMDNDKNTLPIQQQIKQGVQKAGNTARAAVKPITRAKQWLNNMINSLIKRDEEQVKKELIENRGYRTAFYKACRIALKLGLTATFAMINPYFGIIYAAFEGLKIADKERLRKEVQDEFATELKILDEKIEQTKHHLEWNSSSPDAAKRKQELWQLMRTRDKMRQMVPSSMKSIIKPSQNVY